VTRNLVWLAMPVACGGIQTAVDASISDASDDVIAADVVEATATCPRIDASNCKTGANILHCDEGNIGSVCLDDGSGHCSPYADASCEASCTSDEWGAFCGFGGNVPTDPPSQACRFVLGLPSGTAGYCCPCN
jgi:hypothetical protein